MRRGKGRSKRFRGLKKTVKRLKRLRWLGPLYKNRKKLETAFYSLNYLASGLLKK